MGPRTAGVVGAAVVTAAATGCGDGAVRPGSAQSRSAGGDATVALVRAAPPAIRGDGFAAGERVEITVVTDGRTVLRRAVWTDAGGTFTTPLPPFLSVDVCRGFVTVGAADASGRQATTRLPCRPPDVWPGG